MAPMRDCLHYLLEPLFAHLPERARILSVGTGTGLELSHLAQRFPHWRFTAVDPSVAMLQICRARAEAEGFASRCEFHKGYVSSLPGTADYDGATCFLVSHFILDAAARTAFFADIAARLRTGAVLANADLSGDVDSSEYEALSRAWFVMMTQAEVQSDAIEKWRAGYRKDVAILPTAQVAGLIEAAGFGPAVQFYQAGLIRGWFAHRSPRRQDEGIR
jgi:tRNA (cmo5U34)-methyltransferase